MAPNEDVSILLLGWENSVNLCKSLRLGENDSQNSSGSTLDMRFRAAKDTFEGTDVGQASLPTQLFTNRGTQPPTRTSGRECPNGCSP